MKKWKPSAAQKKAFAEKMKDENFANDYFAKKQAEKMANNTTSQFDYATAGGSYIPTQIQYDYAFNNTDKFKTADEKTARERVLYGHINKVEVHHDYIHIINDKIRKDE